jgi:hypothetical protein
VLTEVGVRHYGLHTSELHHLCCERLGLLHGTSVDLESLESSQISEQPCTCDSLAPLHFQLHASPRSKRRHSRHLRCCSSTLGRLRIHRPRGVEQLQRRCLSTLRWSLR